jgi:RNA polymerase sigma factor (sigma-70 family)
MDQPPPDGLFERLARGERGAIEEVCRIYGDRVASIARRKIWKRLRRRLETADVAQDAMVEILRLPPGERFDSEAAFLAWVHRVVEHRIQSAARYFCAERRRADREVSRRSSWSLADPQAARPSELMQANEAAERMSVALAGLSSEDRQIVTSRLLLKLPWKKVAASMEISPAAAQMRYLRARQRLSAVLKESSA